MAKTCSLFPNDGKMVEYKDSLAFIFWRIPEQKGSVLKSIGLLDKIRGAFEKDFFLYLMIISIFLPFYLFLALFALYLIGLLVTGEMKGIIKGLIKHPVLLFLLPIVVSSLSSPRTGLDWLHLY